MNVVDSSGWLEYFADGSNADFFAPAIEDTENLIVPAISVYEVFKRVYQQRGEGNALQAVAMMEQGQVIELGTSLALRAAKVSSDLKIPMADSIILAATWTSGATLWTQDTDFAEVDGVKYKKRGKENK